MMINANNSKALLRIGLVRVLLVAALSLGLIHRNAAAAAAQLAARQAGVVDSIAAYAYSNGWLLCADTDGVQGSVHVYRESPVGSGNFTFVVGAGGYFSPSDLEQLAGVDRADAEVLVKTLTAELDAGSVGSPPPKTTCSGCGADVKTRQQ